VGVVVVALEAGADVGAELAAVRRRGARAVLVELADGEVLRAQVPVYVHRAQARLEVRRRDRHTAGDVHEALVAGGDVGTGLLRDTLLEARLVLEA